MGREDGASVTILAVGAALETEINPARRHTDVLGLRVPKGSVDLCNR